MKLQEKKYVLVLIVLSISILSLIFLPNFYAKYKTRREGNDEARVITFNNLTLREEGDFDDNGKMIIIPGVNLRKKAIVECNESEAATYVFVKVDLADNWVKEGNMFKIKANDQVLMKWQIADEWKFLKQEDNSFIYYYCLPPNTSFSQDVISNDGLIEVSNQITKEKMNEFAPTTITIQAKNVQSGGFESIQAAWDSLKAKG